MAIRMPCGRTPLWRAAESGASRVIQALAAAGADPEAVGGEEEAAPLHRAAAGGHKEAVLALLAAGADGAGRCRPVTAAAGGGGRAGGCLRKR